MLPLARYRAPGDAFLLGPAGVLAAGAFFAQVARLANALPEARHVINLCQTRHGFMLGFAAALSRGQVSLLPPGRARADWESLAARHPDATILAEAPPRAPNGFALAAFLGDAAPGAVFAIPEVPPDRVAAILFTSGSTGEPKAHAKTWAQLWRGAEVLSQALGWRGDPAHAIVGSVPPQHMFGLETTVVLPWREGLPVHGHEPLLPADVEVALAECGRPAWWMTTPMHLRAPVQSDARLRGLQGVIASTMSLPQPLAAAAEAAWDRPVVEIYGSTETGALALRRTASGEAWRSLPGVDIVADGEGESRRFVAHATHCAGAVVLGDVLELGEAGRFRWLARHNDLVKVSGKRASLAALELALTGIPGVDDGVFAFPADAPPGVDEFHPARRLAAFYVSASLEPPAVLAALRDRVDPAFLPRPLHRVARLPRNANGKLPRAAVDALFAQCRLQEIDPNHPALPGHFPGRPIVPGVTVLGRVAEALRARFPHREPGEIVQARFHHPLGPGEAFAIETRAEGDRVRFEVRAAPSGTTPGRLFASGSWMLAPARPPPGA